MIGAIEGEVMHKDERSIVISAGGVGFAIAVAPQTLEGAAVGKHLRLWTHLAVRDDALELFGFATRDELAFFRLLIGISGIGPKSALSVLALADIATLRSAIAAGDSAYLTKVSGIGKKLAQKIVLELKEKVGAVGAGEDGSGISHPEHEALDALEALGYAPRDTREIVRALAKKHATTQEIIRYALKSLGER